MSLKDMRDELRALRKESVKPVSRMKKTDIAMELEKLRGKREETPPVAATPGPKPKKAEPKIADVKVAKEHEFPVAPTDEKKRVERSRLVWLLANLLPPTPPPKRVISWPNSRLCSRRCQTQNKYLTAEYEHFNSSRSFQRDS